MDLAARHNIAQCIRVEMSCLALSPDVLDFLALLTQWESGAVSGRPAPLPVPDPARETGRYPA